MYRGCRISLQNVSHNKLKMNNYLVHRGILRGVQGVGLARTIKNVYRTIMNDADGKSR